MKQNFKEQFTNLREIIKANVDTLISLLKQSDHLAELIKSLNSSTEINTELKVQLEESKEEISKSISALIQKTNDLFKVYESLVEQVFGK